VYTTDCENRLIEVTTLSDHWLFTYDAFGNRVKINDNGSETEFVIDPIKYGDIVGEYDCITKNPIAYYDHGYGLLTYIAESLATPETYFYSYDAIGNTSELTDDEISPGVKNDYSYDPFGVSLSKNEAVENPFEYVGEYGVMNEDCGIEFMRARFYDPEIGRFMAVDPMGLNGGDVNLYRYAYNSSTQYIDPTGQYVQYIPIIIFVVDVLGGAFIDGWPDLGSGGSDWGTLAKSLGEWIGNTMPLPDYDPNAPMIVYTTGGAIFIPPVQPPKPDSEVCEEGDCENVASVDPNEIIGPSGYGPWRVVDLASLMPYRVNFENDETATAPAQVVNISDPLDDRFDWATFKLTGIGFGNINISIAGSNQYFETVVPFSYGGEELEVQIEAGIHLSTGEVYANFYSIDPDTNLPPAAGIGFLPPEDETGCGKGYFTYTIMLKQDLLDGKKAKTSFKMKPKKMKRHRIPNIAYITFDFQETIATNQIDPHDPSQGTDPEKEAYISVLFPGSGSPDWLKK